MIGWPPQLPGDASGSAPAFVTPNVLGVLVDKFSIKSIFFEMTGEERFRPSPLFEPMVNENRLGRKTRRGFYAYE